MKKYYLAHKNKLFDHSEDPRAIKFILWISP